MNPVPEQTDGAPAAPADDGLDRGGHLSELALDRYRFEPDAPLALRQAVEAHLEGCGACRTALARIVEEDERLGESLHNIRKSSISKDVQYAEGVAPTSAGPESSPAMDLLQGGAVGASLESARPAAEVIPLRGRSFGGSRLSRSEAAQDVPLHKRKLMWLALPLAAAAALVLAVVEPLPQEETETEQVRLKGTTFEIEVHVHDGQTSRLVSGGDVVHPGERMGFRVRASMPGHLLLIGRDDRGATYPCYPASGQASAPVAGSSQMVALDAALAFDDALGTERLIAFFCDAPLELPGLAIPSEIPPGCVRRELSLTKVAWPAAPAKGSPQ
jgi:hypothetical protein